MTDSPKEPSADNLPADASQTPSERELEIYTGGDVRFATSSEELVYKRHEEAENEAINESDSKWRANVEQPHVVRPIFNELVGSLNKGKPRDNQVSAFDVLGFLAEDFVKEPPLENKKNYQLGEVNMEKYPSAAYKALLAKEMATAQARTDAEEQHASANQLEACRKAEMDAVYEKTQMMGRMRKASTLITHYFEQAWEHHQKTRPGYVEPESSHILSEQSSGFVPRIQQNDDKKRQI